MRDKLIVCCGSMMAGGAERVLSILSKTFADTFDSVEYIMWIKSDVFYKIDPRVKLTFLDDNCNSSNFLKKAVWFRKHIRETKPTLILSFMVMINFITIASLLGLDTNIIVSERNDPRVFGRNKFWRYLINTLYLLPKVKRIIMQTINNKNYFKRVKLLYNKTTVVYNPVIMPHDYIGSGIMHSKKDLIVSVGRLAAQKRHDLLLKAFSIFKKTHSSYKLIIYGEGNQRSKLEKLILELGLEDSVSLPGISQNVWDDIKAAKMFVMSSDYEGMSNSLIEAMCIGTPVISTKVSGAIDLIKNGKNGILVEVDNYNQLEEAMSLIADNTDIALDLSNNSIEVINHVNIDTIQEQWLMNLSVV